MIQKIIALAVVFSMLAPLVAQEKNYGIPKELRGEFRRQRLKVELTTAERQKYNKYRTDILWEVYRGFEPLAEIDFYNLTGYEELANNVLERDKKNRAKNVAGWSLYGASGVLFVLSVLVGLSVIDIVPSEDAISFGNLLVAAGGATLASGLYTTAWFVRTGIDDTQVIEHDTAISISDEYNQRLADTFMEVDEESTPVSFSKMLLRYSYLPEFQTIGFSG